MSSFHLPPTSMSARRRETCCRPGGSGWKCSTRPVTRPGSISLVADDAIFAGDTLFAGSVGRTDLPGGDSQQLLRAITHKLFSFEEDLPVYPGHGPATTLGEERRSNPFVGTSGGLWTP